MSAVSTVKSEATRCFNSRNAAINDHPSILTDIFQENINLIEKIKLFSKENKLIFDLLISKLKNRFKVQAAFIIGTIFL